MAFISYVLNPQKRLRQTPPQLQTHQILQHLLKVVGLVIRVSQMGQQLSKIKTSLY